MTQVARDMKMVSVFFLLVNRMLLIDLRILKKYGLIERMRAQGGRLWLPNDTRIVVLSRGRTATRCTLFRQNMVEWQLRYIGILRVLCV